MKRCISGWPPDYSFGAVLCLTSSHHYTIDCSLSHLIPSRINWSSSNEGQPPSAESPHLNGLLSAVAVKADVEKTTRSFLQPRGLHTTRTVLSANVACSRPNYFYRDPPAGDASWFSERFRYGPLHVITNRFCNGSLDGLPATNASRYFLLSSCEHSEKK